MGKATAKAWRIFHFRERFDMPGYCRNSGLHSTRDFVSAAASYEAARYIEQFGLLDNGDGLELCMMQGLFRRLVHLTALHSKTRRSYLIDADDKPLTDSQIGKLFQINDRTMGKILQKFASVGLISKVELPEFAAIAG